MEVYRARRAGRAAQARRPPALESLRRRVVQIPFCERIAPPVAFVGAVAFVQPVGFVEP